MWDMRFAWNRVPNSYSSWKLSPTDPYPNAVLVGCSVIVQKDFFYKIGKIIIVICHNSVSNVQY